MEVRVLGSGGAFCAARNPAGYAVTLDDGRVVLLDLGFGNVRALQRAKVDLTRVTDVFISHKHPDHVGDLSALLFHFRYDVKPRSGTLRLWGPGGFSRFVRDLRKAFYPWNEPRGYALELAELKGEAFRDDWEAAALPVPHPTAAFALRFSYKGKTLVYSGDTGYCPELADFAAGADLFLLECATTEKQAYEGHMTPRLALATLEASGCEKGVLTHLNEPSLAELSKMDLGRFTLAKDGQRFKL
jgi:ribonuclease BN (tRNA processing enzyme)